MRRHMTWLVAALFAVGLAGCNTMEGLGEDLQAGGNKLQDWADRDSDKAADKSKAQQQAKADIEE